MSIIFIAILPTILLLVLGNLLRRREFVAPSFWASSDKLTYFVLFPSLLITKVSQVDLSTINFALIFAFFIFYFAIASGLAWGIYYFGNAKPKQFSSIYQGVLRFNSYVYFAIIEAVWGQATLATAALIAGICIPIVNVCCVASFSVGSGRFEVGKTLLSIIKNPLILGSLLGFLANLFPVLLPVVLFETFAILSKAALPLALLSVGAAVRINMLFRRHDGFTLRSLWLSVIAGLLIAPLLAWTIANTLGIGHDITTILVMFAAVPTATSSYILSKQLGGDADMMATMISLQTIVSLFSLMFWLGLLI